VCGFPETEINLENTSDLVGKSRKNVENRGKTEKTLKKTVTGLRVYTVRSTENDTYVMLQCTKASIGTLPIYYESRDLANYSSRMISNCFAFDSAHIVSNDVPSV
jgi:hypothetical protein